MIPFLLRMRNTQLLLLNPLALQISSIGCPHFFSLNFYLGDKIQQFNKVLPQDGVLMIPEEDMPDFLEKFGKDYTFQKVWEVRKTVEWHNKVDFYRFVKTSANIALNK